MKRTIHALHTKALLVIGIALGLQHSALAQSEPSSAIRLNQVGFYPDAAKRAVVVWGAPAKFTVVTASGKQVFAGTLTGPRQSSFSPTKTYVADFSQVKQAGTYNLVVEGVGRSYPFVIAPKVHEDVAKASIKAFYYQRTALPLEEKYAGRWHRPAAHPDDSVIIHPSAATPQHPAGSVINGARGWYDAGDYNKYIVNSGITMGTLLSAYEDFPAYYDTLKLNIPESGNALPDLLDEALWNLQWMLTMQDEQGGVYHKLTNPGFDGMIMPHKARSPRYVVQQGTAATLDFAAVMAQASRIFKQHEAAPPGFSRNCLTAAQKAWTWAKAHPNVVYDQDAMNKQFDPDVATGGYGDRNFTDEFIWAAAELYATTHDDAYYTAIKMLPDTDMPLPSWGQVRLLGYYTLLRMEKTPPAHANDLATLRKQLIAFADRLTAGVEARPYMTVMGGSASDFIWGSNSVAANQAIVLLQAYRLTRNVKYITGALANLDYLLGRNATGYSFVTGYGVRKAMHPHHRPSEADGIVDPVPGFLVGGPNPGMQDKCHYESSVPDEAFTDETCSYASNEVAINWNAPLVYLAGALEAWHAAKGKR